MTIAVNAQRFLLEGNSSSCVMTQDLELARSREQNLSQEQNCLGKSISDAEIERKELDEELAKKKAELEKIKSDMATTHAKNQRRLIDDEKLARYERKMRKEQQSQNGCAVPAVQ